MRRRRHTVGGIIGIIIAGAFAIAGMIFLGILVSRMYTIYKDSGQTISGLMDMPVATASPSPEVTPAEEDLIAEEDEEEDDVSAEDESQPSETPESVVSSQHNTEINTIFSRENANRAAIVSLTNYFASDIYDGKGELDYGAIHSYADTSGETNKYLIYDNDTGIWTAKSENQWHVDALQLNFASGMYLVVSLDVLYDAENDLYIISNIVDDDSESSAHVDFASGSAFYYVQPYMIEGERWA